MLKTLVASNRNACMRLARRWPRAFSTPGFSDRFQEILSHLLPAAQSVLEAGGIDRPALKKSPGFTYVGLDIEHRPGCDQIYDEFLVQSVEAPIPRQFDLAISITLLEHVPSNQAAIESLFAALKPGGVTAHYVPSKYHPYAVALRLVSPTWQKRLIHTLRPHAQAVTGYPTYFDYCSGREMQALFERVGFREVRVEHFYRANDYFAFFLPAYLAITAFERCCATLGLGQLASGFIITARKPG